MTREVQPIPREPRTVTHHVMHKLCVRMQAQLLTTSWANSAVHRGSIEHSCARSPRRVHIAIFGLFHTGLALGSRHPERLRVRASGWSSW